MVTYRNMHWGMGVVIIALDLNQVHHLQAGADNNVHDGEIGVVTFLHFADQPQGDTNFLCRRALLAHHFEWLTQQRKHKFLRWTSRANHCVGIFRVLTAETVAGWTNANREEPVVLPGAVDSGCRGACRRRCTSQLWSGAAAEALCARPCAPRRVRSRRGTSTSASLAALAPRNNWPIRRTEDRPSLQFQSGKRR